MTVYPSCSTWKPETEDKPYVWLGSHPTPLTGRTSTGTFMIWTEADSEPAEVLDVHVAEKRRTAIIETDTPVSIGRSIQVQFA